MTTAAAPFTIGDRLIYDGRACEVHGFTPMSVEPARIYLNTRDSTEIVPVSTEALSPTRPEHEAA